MARFPASSQMEHRGLNHIADVCRALNFIWRPTPTADVGIDGEIEIVEGDQATGHIIKVQSRAGKSYVRNEKSDRFDFYADANELEYWAGATNPVILVIFDPESQRAFWVDVKKYIRIHPKVLAERPHKIAVLKTTDVFSDTSGEALRSLFVPDCSAFADEYRQHVVDRYSTLTLYSVTSDAPIAVDLERVFVKLTTTHQRIVLDTDQNEAALTRNYEATAGSFRFQRPSGPSGGSQRQTKEISVVLSLSEALLSHSILAIIGAPGAGKTTLLKYLALTFARDKSLERLNLDERRVPFFIALRDFNRFIENLNKDGKLLDITSSLLPDFIVQHLQDTAPALCFSSDLIRDQLSAGNCIILLDGLDEIADPFKRARSAEAVASIITHFNKNRFVLTSRPRGWEGESKQRLSILCSCCSIREFDDEDMAEFSLNWYEATTRDRMGDSRDWGSAAQRQADDLLRAIRANQRVKALAHNPLLLSVLAMVHQRGLGLPQRRSELYDECTDLLLGYWDQTKGGEAARELAGYGELSRSEKRSLLEPVALWYHERGDKGVEADKEDLKRQVAQQFEDLFGDGSRNSRRRAELFVALVDERAGLLVEREAGVYAFAHLTFQEYLAARAIADREDYIQYTLSHLHDPWWREVILLEIGHLSDGRHFKRRARQLTTDLVKAIYQQTSDADRILQRNLLFAGRCLADIGKLGIEDGVRRRIIDDLLLLWRQTKYRRQAREVTEVLADLVITSEWNDVLSGLLKCLTSRDAGLTMRTLEALQYIGPVASCPRLVQILLELTYSGRSDLQDEAVQTLVKMGDAAVTKSVIVRLLELTAEPDASVQASAQQALREIGPRAAGIVTREQVLAMGSSTDDYLSDISLWVADTSDSEPNVALDEDIDDPEYSQLSQDWVEYIVETATGDFQWEERSMAIEALGDTGGASWTPEVLESVLELTFDPDIDIRYGAICALGEAGEVAGTPDVIERLISIISKRGELYGDQLRHVAVYSLGQIGDLAATQEAITCLLSLRDMDTAIVVEALLALDGMGVVDLTGETIDELVSGLTADEEGARRQALQILATIDAEGSPYQSIDVSPSLEAERLGNEDRAEGRALAWLGEADLTSDTAERLLSLTADVDDEDLRYSAVLAIKEMGERLAGQGVTDRLLSLASEEDAWMRCAATWALGAVGMSPDKRSLGQLLVRTHDNDARVRLAALEAIGEIGLPLLAAETLDHLTRLAEDANPAVRSAAVWATGQVLEGCAQDRHAEQLLALAADKNDEVRCCVAYALAKVCGAHVNIHVVNALCALAGDPARSVRLAAAWALRKVARADSTDHMLLTLLSLASDSDASVSCEALATIGETTRTRSLNEFVDDLIDLTESIDVRVRSAATLALGTIAEMTASAAAGHRILSLCDDADSQVRCSAAMALGRVAISLGEQATCQLLRMITDDKRSVRLAAAAGLGKVRTFASRRAALEQIVRCWAPRFSDSSDRDLAYEELAQVALQFASEWSD